MQHQQHQLSLFSSHVALIFVHAQAPEAAAKLPEKSSEPETVWSVDFEQCRISQVSLPDTLLLRPSQ